MTTTVRRERVEIPVTIANGQSLSGAVNLGEMELVGLRMPAAWTTAGITLAGLGSDGSTYAMVRNEAGTEFAVTAPLVNQYVALSYAVTGCMKGLGWIKVRSGTSGTPVTQGGDRVIILVCLT